MGPPQNQQFMQRMPPGQAQMPQNQQMMQLPDDMIGAIKIKDGLFIGDEFSAQVSPS
jgi:hypothetical protein